MDAALAAGAQTVVNDVLNLQTVINTYGTIQTAVGLLHSIPFGALTPYINTLQGDVFALQILINNDPGVP
jgi:hypothetical protein